MASPVNLHGLGKVDDFAQALAALLWPPRCLACGETGADARDLCEPCHAALPWNRQACLHCAIPLSGPAAVCGACLQHPPPLQRTLAACLYGPPLDRLLPRFKFHQDLAAGRLLSQLLLEALSDAPRPQALIPIPLHRGRLRSRGYDQALELARPLGRALALPVLPSALRRVRKTAPQSELAAGARRRNLRGAFVANADAGVLTHVALIDDVMTTGATLHAAARALRRAGVERVDAWVCARVP